MQLEASDEISELPEDFVSAWATVLLDLHERCPADKRGREPLLPKDEGQHGDTRAAA